MTNQIAPCLWLDNQAEEAAIRKHQTFKKSSDFHPVQPQIFRNFRQ